MMNENENDELEAEMEGFEPFMTDEDIEKRRKKVERMMNNIGVVKKYHYQEASKKQQNFMDYVSGTAIQQGPSYSAAALIEAYHNFVDSDSEDDKMDGKTFKSVMKGEMEEKYQRGLRKKAAKARFNASKQKESPELKKRKTKSELQHGILVEEDDEKRFEKNIATMSGQAERNKVRENQRREKERLEAAFDEDNPADYSTMPPPPTETEMEAEFCDPPVQFWKQNSLLGTEMLYRMKKDGQFQKIKTRKMKDDKKDGRYDDVEDLIKSSGDERDQVETSERADEKVETEVGKDDGLGEDDESG